MQSGIYIGTLRHRRFGPIEHAFSYPLFMTLLDIDAIPELMAVSRCTSHNRWNWASFHDSDHLGDPGLPLRARLVRDAASQGLTPPGGPIFLLTHLRYLGYCFNPVSFFYCLDEAGAVRLVLAEVSNTFGGAHRYWLRPDPADGSTSIGTVRSTFRARADKALYVSPFMERRLRYSFAFTHPAERLAVHIAVTADSDAGSTPRFDATLSMQYRPWTSAGIRRALVRHPCMTAAVTAGIHWQAVKLWWKGLAVVPRERADGTYEHVVAPESGRP